MDDNTLTPEQQKALDAIMPTEEQLRIADEEVSIIVLLRGTNRYGPFYAYIAILPSRYMEFIRVTESGERYSMEDYGEVLYYDQGDEPTDEVRQYMADTYGADPHFADTMMEALQRAATNQAAEDNPQ